MSTRRIRPCLGIFAVACGCQAHVPYAQRDDVVAGTSFVLRYFGGGDASSPLVVGIHGRGSGPREFAAKMFADFDEKVELAFPQAPARYWFGWTWFDNGTDDETFTRAVDVAERRLWSAIAALANGRKVFVVGMSQGAILAYTLAIRHPDQVAYAFPIAGFALRDFRPAAGHAAAPVYAVHGTADTTVPVGLDEDTQKALRTAGGHAELREFPGARHEITTAMREDVLAHLRAALHGAR